MEEETCEAYRRARIKSGSQNSRDTAQSTSVPQARRGKTGKNRLENRRIMAVFNVLARQGCDREPGKFFRKIAGCCGSGSTVAPMGRGRRRAASAVASGILV